MKQVFKEKRKTVRRSKSKFKKKNTIMIREGGLLNEFSSSIREKEG